MDFRAKIGAKTTVREQPFKTSYSEQIDSDNRGEQPTISLTLYVTLTLVHLTDTSLCSPSVYTTGSA